MQHLALLGDSILDNRPYTSPEPDTTEHLRRTLGSSWTVELLARDGSTMADLPAQLDHVRSAPDVALLSIGGNDAVDHIGLLDPQTKSNLQILAQLQEVADAFGSRYRSTIAAVVPRVQRLIVCTIYEPPLLDPVSARLARVPLSPLNDQIVRAASKSSVDVLALRAVCTAESDFVKEIEPSPAGAKKIASAIQRMLSDDGAVSHSRVFAIQSQL